MYFVGKVVSKRVVERYVFSPDYAGAPGGETFTRARPLGVGFDTWFKPFALVAIAFV